MATLSEHRIKEYGPGGDRSDEHYLDFEYNGNIYTYRMQSVKTPGNITEGNRYYIIIVNTPGAPEDAIRIFGNVAYYYPEEDYFLGLNDEIVNDTPYEPKEKRMFLH